MLLLFYKKVEGCTWSTDCLYLAEWCTIYFEFQQSVVNDFEEKLNELWATMNRALYSCYCSPNLEEK